MPYCPICHRDFEDGVVYCSFCEELLVDTLEEESDGGALSADGEVIYTAFTPDQADEVEALLTDQNIPCTIRPAEEDDDGIFVPGQDPSLYLDIIVPSEYVDEALLLLEGFLGSGQEGDEALYGEDGFDLPDEE